MKKLAVQLIAFFLCVGVLCLIVDEYYQVQTHSKTSYIKQLWKNPPLQEPYQIVTVGNSHADSGITFAHLNVKGLKLSGVAQRFSLDYAQLQQYSNQIAPGAVVLIPVTPISFAHRPADHTDLLQTNYYDSVSPFFIPDLNVSTYIQRKIVPFVRSGYLLRTRHADAVALRIAQEQRPPATQSPPATPLSIAKGTVIVPTSTVKRQSVVLTGPYIFFETGLAPYMDNADFLFHKWYQTDEFSPNYFAYNREWLEKMIQYCLDQGWRPVLVTIPISTAVRDKLYPDFLQTYLYENLEKTNTHGIPYLDFSDDEIADHIELYGNGDHLNSNGGLVFSYTLMRKLIEMGYLPASADGYRKE